MKAAYVDTSCLVAIAFSEPGSKEVARTLRSYDELFSSNLLEAELRSALRREEIDGDPGDLLAMLSWVHPDRPLTGEMKTVLAVSYVRGADLWHLAVALSIAPALGIDFLTLDMRQQAAGERLGFRGFPVD